MSGVHNFLLLGCVLSISHSRADVIIMTMEVSLSTHRSLWFFIRTAHLIKVTCGKITLVLYKLFNGKRSDK